MAVGIGKLHHSRSAHGRRLGERCPAVILCVDWRPHCESNPRDVTKSPLRWTGSESDSWYRQRPSLRNAQNLSDLSRQITSSPSVTAHPNTHAITPSPPPP